MYVYFLSLLFAVHAIAISFENVPQVYCLGRSTIDLHGTGYISTFSLWQSSSNGLKTLVENIIRKLCRDIINCTHTDSLD